MKEVGLPYTFGVHVKQHNYFRNNLVFLKKIIYLLYFCAVLHLCCCTGLVLVAESGVLSSLSCGARASPWGGFSWCRAQALGFSVVVNMSLAAPQEMESSQRRDQTRVPRIGRWILNHCTGREVLAIFYIKHTSVL